MIDQDSQILLAELLKAQRLGLAQQDMLARQAQRLDQLEAVAKRHLWLLAEQAKDLSHASPAAQAQDAQAAPRLRELEAEIVALQHHHAQERQGLIEELDRIHASKAWRLMAPLRWLRAGLKSKA